MFNLTTTTHKLSLSKANERVDKKILATMGYFLEIHGLHLLYSPFRTIVTELINNAHKANLKREFFKTHNLDLEKDYKEGQKKFTDLLHSSSKELNSLIKKNSLSVHVVFKSKPSEIIIKVQNDSQILKNELRVIKKIFSSTFTKKQKAIKEKEGGGLGLKMTLLMLINLGLKDTLSFTSKTQTTQFKLTIPTAQNIINKPLHSLLGETKLFDSMLPVASQSLLDYEDKIAWTFNQIHLTKDSTKINIQDIELSKEAKPKNILYPESANHSLKETQNLNYDIFKNILISETNEEKFYLTYYMEIFLLSDRISFYLSKENITQILKATNRNSPLQKSHFPMATLGLYPGSLLFIWAKKNLPSEHTHLYLPLFENGDNYIMARILYLYWVTMHSTTKKEFHWDLYSKHIQQNISASPRVINILTKIKEEKVKND